MYVAQKKKNSHTAYRTIDQIHVKKIKEKGLQPTTCLW